MTAKPGTIKLPPPRTQGEVSLEEALFKRRSYRQFLEKNLSWGQISQLLWAAQGITLVDDGLPYRTAPSAGALYPMELYLLTQEGLYHYVPDGHYLKVLKSKDLRKELSDAALGQEAVYLAPANIVICAVYKRVTAKYHQRGIQYVHIEAGHIGENILLQAVSLGLASVPIGAFEEGKVQDVLQAPENHEPLCIVSVGYAELAEKKESI